MLGVPPGMYSKEYSRKIVDSIRASDIRVNGEPYRVSGNVRIIPQGAGIFFRHIKDHQEDRRKNVTVIDIGHHTVDMVLFAEGKYVESATESQEIGVSFVLDSIVKAFYREHRLSIGFRAALDILRDRQIVHLGTLYKIDIQEEMDAYVRRVRSVIDRYLEKLPVHVDLGIIGGGGAVMKDLSGGHRLLLVSEPGLCECHRVLALRHQRQSREGGRGKRLRHLQGAHPQDEAGRALRAARKHAEIHPGALHQGSPGALSSHQRAANRQTGGSGHLPCKGPSTRTSEGRCEYGSGGTRREAPRYRRFAGS